MSEAFAPFERVAILGLGLLGGSVALAARSRGAARFVVGAGRRRAPLEAALAAGVVDAIADPAEAVVGADLIVLGTPVGAMPALVRAVATHLEPGAIVTDVGSVKASLVDTLPGLLPEGVHYVGSHPMAGSHRRGAAHSREDLFEGAACIVTEVHATDPGARARVRSFWQTLGARVVLRDPVAHDAEVAWMSHVPHVLAFAFAAALDAAPRGGGELAGPGFRDFTRIAGSEAELWGDILSANRKALAAPLEAFGEKLKTLARAIEEGDTEGQEQFLASARATLSSLVTGSPAVERKESAQDARPARSGGENPEIQAAPEKGGHPRSQLNNHE